MTEFELTSQGTKLGLMAAPSLHLDTQARYPDSGLAVAVSILPKSGSIYSSEISVINFARGQHDVLSHAGCGARSS